MNKTAIRKFAEWAREKLIEDIKYKVGTVGITENGIAEKLPQSTSDTYFYDVGTKDYMKISGVEPSICYFFNHIFKRFLITFIAAFFCLNCFYKSISLLNFNTGDFHIILCTYIIEIRITC